MSDPAAPATAPAPEPAAPAQGNIVSEQEYRRPPPGDFPDLDSETRSVRQPALPPLPRAIELRGPEHWRTRIQEAGGPLVERDTAIAAALSAQATMAEGLAALEQARQTRDPRMHAAAHLEAVKAGYDRLLTEGARRRDAAMAALDARERELQVEADARTQLVPSEDVADIRAALLRMSPDKRSEALHKALTTGDTAVLAAVFSGRAVDGRFRRDPPQPQAPLRGIQVPRPAWPAHRHPTGPRAGSQEL